MSIYVALGGNLPPRRATLEAALVELETRGVGVRRRSGLYETDPIGIPSDRAFLNAVIEVAWGGTPRELLAALQQVETALGRRRGHPAGDRTCDLDLLLFHGRRVAEDDLCVPHRGMGGRRFVLEPLLELDPGLADPVTGDAWSTALPRVVDQRCRRVFEAESWGPRPS